MNIKISKLKKALIIIISFIITIITIIILFVSPITKYLVEKYDEKYTGRQIKMDWVYVNPFTGYVYFHNLKIYEYKSDSIFISVKGLSANISKLKLFSKTLYVTNLTFNEPKVIIIQKNRNFNFDDFATTFSSKDGSHKSSKPFHFYFINIKINNGHFFYVDKVTPVNFSIKNVSIESKEGWRWDKEIISAKVSFLSEIGNGGMKGQYSMNLKSLDYTLDIVVNNFDMKVIEQYLKGFANYGTFNAMLNANLNTRGCYKDAENINIKGQLAINNFHFGKNIGEDYLSFDKVAFYMNDVNPKKHRYFVDSMFLFHPFFKYEQYDNLNNIQTMFGENEANISAAKSNHEKFNLVIKIADYIKVLAKNFFQSDYKINKLAIYKGNFKFNDYSLTEKFSIEANPLSIVADSINKSRKRVAIFFKSGIKPYGNISVSLSINPKDSGDFDMEYMLQKLPVTIFNPYLIKYTSYPLNRGTIEINGKWKVKNSILNSDNHLLIIDPRVTKRIKNRETNWIPLPLIMFFVRDHGNVIDYKIPITGNLNNPTFHIYNIIINTLKNIFVKPATTSYRIEVKNLENEIEKSLTLKWEMRQSTLLPNQEKFVKQMVDFLVNNLEATITVHPMFYEEKENEYILFFEAKKKYFLSKHNNVLALSSNDSIAVEKMSIKDDLFVQYLNKQVRDTMLFTMQEKCNKYVGSAIIIAKLKQLNNERKNVFISQFKKNNIENRVKLYAYENYIPYNGFSFYKIDYNGKFPKSLVKAYWQMNELNNESPRKKFEKEREKNKN